MATVTKPIALDETFRTTDGNNTNIADLLKDLIVAVQPTTPTGHAYTNYNIYSISGLLIINFFGFSGNSISATLTDNFLGMASFYDTITHDNVHINISTTGAVSVNSSSDTPVSTYNLYGTCTVVGTAN